MDKLQFLVLICIQANISKWILLKWITRLNGYHLSGPIVKYKTWLSGYSASVDAHNQVPVLSSQADLTVYATV